MSWTQISIGFLFADRSNFPHKHRIWPENPPCLLSSDDTAYEDGIFWFFMDFTLSPLRGEVKQTVTMRNQQF